MKHSLRKIRRFGAVGLASVLSMCLLLTACGEAPQAERAPSETSQPTTQVQTQPTESSGQIQVKDSLGREITLEKIPEKVIADNPACLRLYTYVNGMEKIIGVSEREKKSATRRPYALAYSDVIDVLPSVGGGGYGIDNYEALLLAEPDVFFMDTGKEAVEYEEIQKKTGIPVVVLDYGTGVVFDSKLYESIQIIGTVMGKEARAQEVIDYMEGLRKDLEERTKDIPEDEIVCAYAAGMAWSGSHGIEATRGNYPLFDVTNVKNVAAGTGKTAGMVEIDKEQLIQWDPDYIFLDLASIHLIQEDYNKNKPFYQSLTAFREGRVYAQLPFVWCDVNIDTAMADAYYVGKICYPDRFQDIDPIEKTNEIYEMLVGKPVYDQIADFDYGGFQEVTLEKLDNSTYFKSK